LLRRLLRCPAALRLLGRHRAAVRLTLLWRGGARLLHHLSRWRLSGHDERHLRVRLLGRCRAHACGLSFLLLLRLAFLPLLLLLLTPRLPLRLQVLIRLIVRHLRRLGSRVATGAGTRGFAAEELRGGRSACAGASRWDEWVDGIMATPSDRESASSAVSAGSLLPGAKAWPLLG
jgi:hypothetical protein